jgi:hypothetical protein
MESPKDRTPWLLVIPTRVGQVYPYSDALLAVTCDGHPYIAAELARFGLRAVQDGDREKTFVATPEQFECVAHLIRPRRRRRLSDAEKARRAALISPGGTRPRRAGTPPAA